MSTGSTATSAPSARMPPASRSSSPAILCPAPPAGPASPPRAHQTVPPHSRLGPPNPAVLLPGGLIRRAAPAAPAIVASLPWTLATRATVGKDSAGPQPAPSEGQVPAGPRSVATPGTLSLPRWRAVLEGRWQARLSKVTELSVAYHDTAELIQAAYHSGDHASQRQLQRLLHQAVTARRALADTEEALSRLSAGRYGRCEQCAAAIPPRRLAFTPEARYCPSCAPEPAMPPR